MSTATSNFREAGVRDRGAAAVGVTGEHLAAALHECRAAVRERLGEHHREALEERRLRERERARERGVAHVGSRRSR